MSVMFIRVLRKAGRLTPSTPENSNGERPPLSTEAAGKLMRAATWAAIALAITLIISKGFAWIATESIAILGSLVDSVLDLLASAINFIAVRAALEPPDEEHRFGHGKAEAIAGLMQAAVILGSAAFLILESIERLIHPVAVEHPQLGIGISGFAIVITLALVMFQSYVVRRTGSLAVESDHLHYKGDLLLNLSVIGALLFSQYSTLPWIDATFGIGIAVYIAWNAKSIGERAMSELMDREFTTEDREKIFNLVLGNSDVWGMHELKTRRSGLTSFIQMHVELDPKISLMDAHTIADEVEATVGEAFPNAEILIHTDPYGLENVETVHELNS